MRLDVLGEHPSGTLDRASGRDALGRSPGQHGDDDGRSHRRRGPTERPVSDTVFESLRVRRRGYRRTS
ncbi:hypothetical protein C9J85_14090 [Haloferax sp. wsp5]|nr:hypothetical protein C9J85_14090 [Haloferax sp. wsp5]